MMKWLLFSLFLPQDVVDHHLQMPCKWSSWHWPICHLCSHEYFIREMPSGFHGSRWKSGGLCFTAEMCVQRKKMERFLLPSGTEHQLLCSLYQIFSWLRPSLLELFYQRCEMLDVRTPPALCGAGLGCGLGGRKREEQVFQPQNLQTLDVLQPNTPILTF